MSELQVANSVYSIEIEKIDPNPDQPRKHFSEESLRDLSESIRRYGVMQPITVFRREQETDKGISTRYEIIAGERRWRASIQAGMSTIPAIIQDGLDSEQDRYELSILENLQREDLNPVDKARSFARLADEFGMKHAEIADRLGKSREYVTNAMRLLALPENILDALSQGEINEGHTRPLLTLKDSPEELQVLFNEITSKGLTVREAETTARSLSGSGKKASRYNPAQPSLDPEMQELQTQLAGALGTSVSIDKKEKGGKLTIDFFSRDDLKKILTMVNASGGQMAMAGVGIPVDEKVTSDAEMTNQVVIEETVAEPEELASGATILHEEIVAPATKNSETLKDSSTQEQITEGENQIASATDAFANQFNPQYEAAKPLYDHTTGEANILTKQVGGSDLAADFIEPQRAVGGAADTVDLGESFDVTPRSDMIELDPSLEGKPIMTTSAHQAESNRNIIGQSNFVSEKAKNLQKEIDALAGQTTAHDLANGTGRMELDLGELEIGDPQINQDFQRTNPNNQDALGVNLTAGPGSVQMGAPRYAQVESEAVSSFGEGFVPEKPETTGVSEIEGDVSGGSEFVPHQPPAGDRYSPQSIGEQATVSSSAEITMGGLDGSMGNAGDRPFEAGSQSRPTNATDQYPNGDPYRLDNFSV